MAKDTSRITSGELQKIVESRGQKTLKNYQTAPTSPLLYRPDGAAHGCFGLLLVGTFSVYVCLFVLS